MCVCVWRSGWVCRVCAAFSSLLLDAAAFSSLLCVVLLLPPSLVSCRFPLSPCGITLLVGSCLFCVLKIYIYCIEHGTATDKDEGESSKTQKKRRMQQHRRKGAPGTHQRRKRRKQHHPEVGRRRQQHPKGGRRPGPQKGRGKARPGTKGKRGGPTRPRRTEVPDFLFAETLEK